ncbi:MAG: glycosyltransferase family 4 protein [Planctomycetota bacterium]|jgi:glycosyltransferase involved in cell wall biosynthesis|nr:glycosyltransferase family 4 protein [Planctomycetota bacterium]
MRILVAHHRYQSALPSGENAVVDREAELLTSAGHHVIRMETHADDLIRRGWRCQLDVACKLAGARFSRQDFAQRIAVIAPDIVHIHNPWPTFTFELALAAKLQHVPCVQTLHNYRLIATDSHWIRDRKAQRPQSNSDQAHLRRLGTDHGGGLRNHLYTHALKQWWTNNAPNLCTDRFICLTEFQRRQITAAGVLKNKIVIKPNFLQVNELIDAPLGNSAIFVGRLDDTKGIRELIANWDATSIPLSVVGDGPLRSSLPNKSGITYHGRIPLKQVLYHMARSRFLVMNSQVYEGFPLTIIEALASGIPTLAPHMGGPQDIIEQGRTGRTFVPGDWRNMKSQALRLWQEAPNLRAHCRETFLSQYTPQANLRQLEAIYRSVLQ